MVGSFVLATPAILADVRLGWLTLFAASGMLGVTVGGIIMVTVWLTGGLHGGK